MTSKAVRQRSKGPTVLMFVAALAACACALPGAASAQELTGVLIGTVKDAQGAVIAGAAVRVESSALIGGPAALKTNEKGQLRFVALPVGDYTLLVEVPGFETYREPDIRIGLGATMERTIVLQLAKVADSVVVRGSGSRIDARDPGIGARFDRDVLNAIPTRRFSMIDPIRFAPGVSPTSPASGSINSVSIFGSGTNENRFLIDGTDQTCPCSGEARSEPGVDFIQEVQIRSVGASAEFGNAQGGIINVITRQGGDVFRYDASYYGQSPALTSGPVRKDIPGSGGKTSTYERVKYRDFTATAGGPAWRNRLWFFAGYQHLRDYDSQPGTDPAFPRTYEQDKLFGKLTWRLSPTLLLVQSLHVERWVNPELPTSTKPFQATQRLNASVPAMTFGHLTHTLSSRTVWDLRVGGFIYTRHDDPSTGDVTIPSRIDRVTGVLSGAPQTIGGLKLLRTTAKGTVDHYQPAFLGADHHWRVGGQFERGEHRLSTIIPTGTRYIDQGPMRFRAESSAPSIVGGVFVTASGFVNHSLTIGSALTINSGVRFDHSRAISQDLRAIDEDGRETGDTIQGLGRMYTWNVWSPRFGFTFRVTDDGRTVLRGSFGRFHQGVLTGELSPFHPGATITATSQFDATTGTYQYLFDVNPLRNLKYDPETRTPYTDAWSIGLDRELGRSLSVAIALVHKRGADFLGWTDVVGQYREETYTVPDGTTGVPNGTTVPVFVLTGLTADRRFLLHNPADYSMHYTGLVLAAEKRRSHGWQAHASYTWSATTGLQASSGASASGPQVSTIANQRFLTFGQDPNTLTNAEGRLPNDRPHMVRVMASADVPWTGLVAAANVRYFTGKPWAASALVPLPQGDVRIQLEQRGPRRLSSQTLVDLRLSRTFAMGDASRVELLLDVFNVFNDTAEEGLSIDNVLARNFGQPTAFVDPRRAMIAARLSFGR